MTVLAPGNRPARLIANRPDRVSIVADMLSVVDTVDVTVRIQEGRESAAIRLAAGDTVEVD